MADIRQLSALEALQVGPALADLLLDCVAGGASVGFMASLTKAQAEAFWGNVAREMEQANRVLLAAFEGSQPVGTVVRWCDTTVFYKHLE